MPRVRVALASLLLALAACSSADGDDSELRTAGVYEAALRWAIALDAFAPATDDLPVLYVVASDGTAISTTTQVAVVEQLRDDANLRFTDAREEALDIDAPGEPVKSHGVLVSVGDVPDEGSSIDLEIAVYQDESAHARYLLALVERDMSWQVTSATEIPGP